MAFGMNTLPKFHDVTVYDELEPCPYLANQTARLPLQVPSQRVSPAETDARLASGQRRTGEFVYATQCPQCIACLPIRLRVDSIRFSRTHRRTLRRNDRMLETRLGPVRVDRQRITMFNRHRNDRGLGRGESSIDSEEYAWAFQRSCFDTFEFAYSLQGQLACVAICDQGANSLSAVYTYYDTSLARLSLGTWSILKQIEYCRNTGREFLYLGFYIAQSRNMSYKATFVPSERLVDGRWQVYDQP
jgi:arginine-tRNA-protein transferase